MLKQEGPRTRLVAIRWAAMFSDVNLFISLCMAHLIVWRALRRERKERLVRLKRIRLIPN